MLKSSEQFQDMYVRIALHLIMGHYSIKDLENLSGIKAHTIRIWEQRYGLLVPMRSETNIRTYDDEELRHLLNVSLLANHGYKISKISGLSRQEVRQELNDLLLNANVESLPMGDQINGLVIAMLELDEHRFNEIYASAKEKMSFEFLVTDLIYPFLRKVGLMWGIEQANPAQEHFVSNLVRRKILAEIDKIPLPEKGSKPFLLFLREGELHEIGLLLADFVLRTRGISTIYLGPNVPLEDVIETAELCQPQALITFFVKPFGEDGQAIYLENLSEKIPAHIYFNSYEPNWLVSKNAERITYVPDIKSLLAEI